jgi:uncharacterized membrane protein
VKSAADTASPGKDASHPASADPATHHCKEIPVTDREQALMRNTLAGFIAIGLAAASSMALAAKGDTEKCAGIVKAGKNDCGTSKSACAGTSTADRDAEAWILVPAGTCERIAGGKVTNKPENVHGGAAAVKKG